MNGTTNRPRVSMVVAIANKSRAICEEGQLLFRISDDLKRFKALTMGHPIIMGRKTFESIGKPLVGRENFVITRNRQFSAPGIIVCHDLDSAMEQAALKANGEVFIIGGGEIYKLALPKTDKLYLTLINSEKEGDAHFPEYSDIFKKKVREENRLDTKENLSYSWIDLER